MKTFEVAASYITHVTTVIEANSIEEAHYIAKDLDGGSFTHKDNFSDWNIDSIEEIKPTYYYCFEMYKYGDGIEWPCFEEETGHSIAEARAKILKHYPKACILNEYKQVIEGEE